MSNAFLFNCSGQLSESETLRLETTDSLNVDQSLFHRCAKCKNCVICARKTHLPSEEKNLAELELLKSNMTYDSVLSKFTMHYLYNDKKSLLPVYDKPVLKRCRDLELKLMREPEKLKAFNVALREFFDLGIIKYIEDCPDMSQLQKSYQPINVAWRDGPLVTTTCRIVIDPSFKMGAQPSYNEIQLQGPLLINQVFSILNKVRDCKYFSVVDVKKMYTNIQNCLADQSLKRIFVKDEFGNPNEPFRTAVVCVNLYGELQAGPSAMTAVRLAAQYWATPAVSADVQNLSCVDDLPLKAQSFQEMQQKKSSLESALVKGGFSLKPWTDSGQDHDDTKFLGLKYKSLSDAFSVISKVNFSKLKRGRREVPDCKNENEIRSCIRDRPVTKRTVASLLHSILFDPLGFFDNYKNLLKLHFRRCCRAGLGWNDRLATDQVEQIIQILLLVLQTDQVSFPRQIFFVECDSLLLLFWFDSSDNICSVVTTATSFYPDRHKTFFVNAKSKILGTDVVHTVRGEISGCLLATRILDVLHHYLFDFLNALRNKGKKVRFGLVSDSEITLHTISKYSYYFKTWTRVRVEEIRATLCGFQDTQVEKYFTPSQNNLSDFLTREKSCLIPPSDIPWVSGLNFDDFVLKQFISTSEKISKSESLPEVNRSHVPINSASSALAVHDNLSLSQLCLFPVYCNAAQMLQQADAADDPFLQIALDLFTKVSSYFKVINILAYCFSALPRNRTDIVLLDSHQRPHRQCDLNITADKAEKHLFRVFQQSNISYCQSFKGNGFYTAVDQSDGCFYVLGRLVADSDLTNQTKLILVPKHTILYSRLTGSLHRRFHKSAEYIRGQAIQLGYYIPAIIPRLRKLSKNCPKCRRDAMRRIDNIMGAQHLKRLTANTPVLKRVQSDIWGPVRLREKSYIYPRSASRPIYFLSVICDYTRYISCVPVRSLSKDALKRGFEQHFFRHGRCSRVECDFGSNYSSLRKDYSDEELDFLSDDDMRSFAAEMNSESRVLIVQRTPRSSATQGSAEYANKMVQKFMRNCFSGKLDLLEIQYLLDKCLYLVNNRPIGLSDSLVTLCPNNLRPVQSDLQAFTSYESYYSSLSKQEKTFAQTWLEYFKDTVIRQSKWYQSKFQLEVNDIVLISDLISKQTGYGVAGRIISVRNDTTEYPRYFTVEYLQNNIRKTVQRQSRSLVILLTAHQDRLTDQDLESMSDCVEEDERAALPADEPRPADSPPPRRTRPADRGAGPGDPGPAPAAQFTPPASPLPPPHPAPPARLSGVPSLGQPAVIRLALPRPRRPFGDLGDVQRPPALPAVPQPGGRPVLQPRPILRLALPAPASEIRDLRR